VGSEGNKIPLASFFYLQERNGLRRLIVTTYPMKVRHGFSRLAQKLRIILMGGSAMKKYLLAAALMTAGVFAGTSSQAGTIPYPNPGTINPAVYTFTASATGTVTGFFFGFNAADVDSIEMLVNGVPSAAGFGFVNQTTAIGSSFDFGNVTAGDTITFLLRNQTTATDFSSNPLLNADLVQHIYSTDFAGNGTIPAGTYVAFEDLLASQGSDFDYNDDSFVFTNLAQVTGTPIPGTLPLFMSGLGALGLLASRKIRKRKKMRA
jgi:hypothetical protein